MNKIIKINCFIIEIVLLPGLDFVNFGVFLGSANGEKKKYFFNFFAKKPENKNIPALTRFDLRSLLLLLVRDDLVAL